MTKILRKSSSYDEERMSHRVYREHRAVSQYRLLKPGGSLLDQKPARLKQAVLTCFFCCNLIQG
jgi:hypothetical protein